MKKFRVKHSLHGLKQASRQWNHEFTSKIQNYGFHQFSHDNCLFILNNKQCLVLLVYVDDFLITGTSEEDITKVKIFLHKLITVKDISYAKYFLGLEIVRSLVTYFNQ